MNYDIEFSVGVIDREANDGMGDIVATSDGWDLAYATLGQDTFKTFSSALKAAKKLRKLDKITEHAITITPMYNTYNNDGELEKGSGKEVMEVLSDGTLKVLDGWED